jgi:sporulation integral membrane protein YtvI
LAVIYFRGYIIASLLPFFLAFILAGLLEPAIGFLVKRRLPRSAAVIIVLVTFLLVAGYLSVLVSSKILNELVDIAQKASSYQERLIEILNNLVTSINEAMHRGKLPQEVSSELQLAMDNLAKTGFEMVKSTINKIIDALAMLPIAAIIVIITIVATYFIAKDYSAITDNLLYLLPERWKKPLTAIQKSILTNMVEFSKAQFVLLLISTFIASVGMAIVGVRYWMTLGLITGILDFIPVVGPGFLFVPWALVSILLGNIPLAIKIGLLYLVMFLTRQLLYPKILGDYIGFHPLLMLVAVYAGIRCLGPSGFIVGPIILIVFRAILHSGLLPIPQLAGNAPSNDTPANE